MKKDIEALEKVQKRATKILPQLSWVELVEFNVSLDT